jgi:hypothetical protein
MSQGASATGVGREPGPLEERERRDTGDPRDHRLSVAEAVLLSVVALLAAWSGYAAAQWSTESRVQLAESAVMRTNANRAQLEASTLRNFDSSTFEAWFAAYIAKNEQGMRIAERRFRPGFAVAFRAWRKTSPETNPNAPPGPTYMPQYRAPGLATARALDRRAEDSFRRGERSGETADKYVRLTVLLATILFLVGISTQFPLRRIRWGLMGLGLVLLTISVAQLTTLPLPDI